MYRVVCVAMDVRQWPISILKAQFTYTQEVFLNLAFKHMRIAEVPIPVRGVREVGKSRVARSLWQYGINTLRIIFRVYRDFRPMQFFGGLALLLAVPGTLLGLFLLGHYFLTGMFSPYKWTGFTSGGLFALSLILLHMGMIGDMLNRHRIYLEELLYFQRNQKNLEHIKDLDEQISRGINPR